MNDAAAARQAVCEQYGSSHVECDPALLVGANLASLDRQPIQGVRLHPTLGMSGWYFWGGDYGEAADFFQPVHASHVLAMLPMIDRYLGLQAGYKFIVDDQGYEDVWYDPSAFERAGQAGDVP